jgi:hypothetical protein
MILLSNQLAFNFDSAKIGAANESSSGMASLAREISASRRAFALPQSYRMMFSLNKSWLGTKCGYNKEIKRRNLRYK